MIRCSQLNIAQYCGLAPRLAESGPPSTSHRGRIGKDVHVFLEKWISELYKNKQTPNLPLPAFAESAELIKRNLNGLFDILKTEGLFDSQNLFVEQKLALDKDCNPVVHGAREAVTQGTFDAAWIDSRPNSGYLLDWKTGVEIPSIRENLQLLAYGLAFAKIYLLQNVTLAIVRISQTGPTVESDTLTIDELMQYWPKVLHASQMDPQAIEGAHCSSCWQRMKCPVKVLPMLDTATRDQALMVLNTTEEVTPVQIATLYDACKTLEQIVDLGKQYVRAFVDSGGVVQINGKMLALSTTTRRSVSVEALESAGLLEQVSEAGALKTTKYTSLRWVKCR